MDSIEFIRNYQKYISEIEGVVKSELLPILQQLKETNPEEIITPDTWFVSKNQARGFVFDLFLQKCKGK